MPAVPNLTELRFAPGRARQSWGGDKRTPVRHRAAGERSAGAGAREAGPLANGDSNRAGYGLHRAHLQRLGRITSRRSRCDHRDSQPRQADIVERAGQPRPVGRLRPSHPRRGPAEFSPQRKGQPRFARTVPATAVSARRSGSALGGRTRPRRQGTSVATVSNGCTAGCEQTPARRPIHRLCRQRTS